MNDIGRDVATLNFMGIENIHSVRDSLAAYCSASQAQGQEFYHAVGASGWLRHLSQVLLGAMVLVGGGVMMVHASSSCCRCRCMVLLWFCFALWALFWFWSYGLLPISSVAHHGMRYAVKKYWYGMIHLVHDIFFVLFVT